jgi:crotonobetainyl-CoA:carnitine CoA-transferase CaiB-like acyl-CoA transferase
VTTIDEVVHSEQLAARDYWRILGHPELGRAFRYPGPFAQFSATPMTYRRRPPTVGEHNRDIYIDELGVTEQQFTELHIRGVI